MYDAFINIKKPEGAARSFRGLAAYRPFRRRMITLPKHFLLTFFTFFAFFTLCITTNLRQTWHCISFAYVRIPHYVVLI